jgi:hypothetical protein
MIEHIRFVHTRHTHVWCDNGFEANYAADNVCTYFCLPAAMATADTRVMAESMLGFLRATLPQDSQVSKKISGSLNLLDISIGKRVHVRTLLEAPASRARLWQNTTTHLAQGPASLPSTSTRTLISRVDRVAPLGRPASERCDTRGTRTHTRSRALFFFFFFESRH